MLSKLNNHNPDEIEQNIIKMNKVYKSKIYLGILKKPRTSTN